MSLHGFTVAAIVSMVALGEARTAEPLKVDSLLKSLMKVQDRIAEGDVAALPLQQHLMKLLDAAIAEAGGAGEMSTEEFRALIIFGIAGTGSRAVIDALREVTTSKKKMQLADAVIDYRNRKKKRAIKKFAKIDITKLDARLQPFVAFANGNLVTRSKPGQAIKYYNLTRLSAPGTLLEEASLRRLMSLHKAEGHGVEFIAMAKQYARRFLKSPYRKQYIALLQSGIFSMRRTIPLKDIGELGQLMPIEFAVAFHMRLIRDALVSGHLKMAEFSIGQMIGFAEKARGVQIDAAQLALFKVLSRMTSGEPQVLLAELDAIDTTALRKDDKRLLASAKRILGSILAPIDEASTGATDPARASDAMEEKKPELAFGASSGPSKSEKMDKDENPDEIDSFINKTQKRLTAIDRMLNK